MLHVASFVPGLGDGELPRLVTRRISYVTTEGLTLETQDEADAAIPTKRVIARGDIDLATAPELETHLSGLVSQGFRVIVIDAAGVDFLDSSGIRVLVQASNDLEPNGGKIYIENMSAPVARILEITGLTERYQRS